ncbi:MAG: outer membrane lipoprotein chaperone LolA [Legionellaceae bacterium]|nr:outer membrane lipoprotein chaperone LolA [Legionellaceae bacterium]
MNFKRIQWCVLIWSVAAFAWSDAPEDILWNKLHHISSMKADFTQKVSLKKRVVSQSSGTMAFERPGHFRWQTKAPMEQLLVADGQQFWMYDIDLEQVTVRPQSAVAGAAAGLFLGDDRERFSRAFKVETAQADEKEAFVLQALAKDANIQKMKLWFRGATLTRMDLYDQLGQQTVIYFKQVQNNVALAARLFRFSPPKGVDVVKQ